MNIKNLHFFDKDGYNLNFKWNDTYGYWEGNIYFPKVSVGLHANTTIYVLEEFEENGEKHYHFPTPTGNINKITFGWDRLNKFVDEFFMFNFDDTYVIKDTSALAYTPNDGPDCETLIVNRFDTYEINLVKKCDDSKKSGYVESNRVLPIHVAFCANERSDATTYNRTLMMYHGNRTIAQIKFFAETIEEDERLKIWNDNLGYNISPEDTLIFYKSDIKEYKPNYQLLNEKRKELMLEGSNIYPYIGSYKAIINAIKFFGYENLDIIEFWRNVNPDDINFGKVYHSSRYSLTKKETIRIGDRNIILPNKDYKKNNQLALIYDINKITGEVDEWELPKVKEQFTYTIEEALIKLFMLRRKLNKEFMPGNSKIIDIIGAADYFGIQGLEKLYMDCKSLDCENKLPIDFEVFPNNVVYITDNRYFRDYILKRNLIDETHNHKTKFVKDLSNVTLESIGDATLEPKEIILENKQQCEFYKKYFTELKIDHTYTENIEDYVYVDDADPFSNASAKVVLQNTTYENFTFGESEINFNFEKKKINSQGKIEGGFENLKFENIDIYNQNKITWKISMSSNQVDEDLKRIGIEREYEYHDWTFTSSESNLTGKDEIYVELPYVGYYDVEIIIDGQSRIKRRYIKVEPHQIEIRGLYHDNRDLPDDIAYDIEKYPEMLSYIKRKLKSLTYWAVPEKTGVDFPIEYSTPLYDVYGNIIREGPYFDDDIPGNLLYFDNMSEDMLRLIPNIKTARYIWNGVDVKPYTWILLTYDYSSIVGMKKSTWKLTNNTTGKIKSYIGTYFTYVLKDEGNYNIYLELEDINGNKYTNSRNIIVVSNTSNYHLYQTFKKDYDVMVEQRMLAETKAFNEFFIE